jgi:hypothetical protein
MGFQPTSFAYPFGSFDADTEAVVAACGFNSGRGVSGVDDTKTFAETMPPLDAYATRTPPNPKQGTTVATIEGYVTAAETHGGGWVQLVFHHVCDGLRRVLDQRGQPGRVAGLAGGRSLKGRERADHDRGGRRGDSASDSRRNTARFSSRVTSER